MRKDVKDVNGYTTLPKIVPLQEKYISCIAVAYQHMQKGKTTPQPSTHTLTRYKWRKEKGKNA